MKKLNCYSLRRSKNPVTIKRNLNYDGLSTLTIGYDCINREYDLFYYDDDLKLISDSDKLKEEWSLL